MLGTVKMTSTQALDPRERGMLKLKKMVYKNRLRMKEYFVDWDKLRHGYVLPTHFVSGLGIAGIDTFLFADEIKALTDMYTVMRTPTLPMVDYRRFCNDLDLVFTLPNLEKDPLAVPADEPSGLIDRDRFLRSNRWLGDDKEAVVAAVLERIRGMVAERGIFVKDFFRDPERNNNSIKHVNHVSIYQFKQELNVQLGFRLTAEEMELLVEKYVNEDYPDMVNFLAFSNTVDPEDAMMYDN